MSVIKNNPRGRKRRGGWPKIYREFYNVRAGIAVVTWHNPELNWAECETRVRCEDGDMSLELPCCGSGLTSTDAAERFGRYMLAVQTPFNYCNID